MRKLANQVKQMAKSVQDGSRSAFRGVLNLVKSQSSIQLTQVSGLADETLQDVELMQQFGFTSVPPAGTQAVVIPLGGKTTHGVVVATENGSFRVKNLASGEVAIYDESGSSVVLKKGKIIEIQCDTLKINASQGVEIDSPQVKNSGDVIAGSISLINHQHWEQGDGNLTSASV